MGWGSIFRILCSGSINIANRICFVLRCVVFVLELSGFGNLIYQTIIFGTNNVHRILVWD